MISEKPSTKNIIAGALEKCVHVAGVTNFSYDWQNKPGDVRCS